MTDNSPRDNPKSERRVGHLISGELVTMESGWVNIYRRHDINQESMTLESARHNAKVLETAANLAELYLYERRGRVRGVGGSVRDDT